MKTLFTCFFKQNSSMYLLCYKLYHAPRLKTLHQHGGELIMTEFAFFG